MGCPNPTGATIALEPPAESQISDMASEKSAFGMMKNAGRENPYYF